MLLLILLWSVLNHEKGVFNPTYRSGKPSFYLENTDPEGLMLAGSFCANESKSHVFLWWTYYSPNVFGFDGEIRDEEGEFEVELFAHKCYPWYLYANRPIDHPYIGISGMSISVELQDSGYLNEYNSLKTMYNGCVDGWSGERCDIHFQMQTQRPPIFTRVLEILVHIAFE
jgi:hypothetical protein